jgi:hypothetical protein
MRSSKARGGQPTLRSVPDPNHVPIWISNLELPRLKRLGRCSLFLDYVCVELPGTFPNVIKVVHHEVQLDTPAGARGSASPVIVVGIPLEQAQQHGSVSIHKLIETRPIRAFFIQCGLTVEQVSIPLRASDSVVHPDAWPVADHLDPYFQHGGRGAPIAGSVS